MGVFVLYTDFFWGGEGYFYTIKIMYDSPVAAVITNGWRSESFNLT